MKHIDFSFPTPAENLAADEALLNGCEAGQEEPVLCFWVSAHYFVVVGYANKIAAEVNQAACAARGIPILRRCSGGGTVVQGPGCLNYSLVLPITGNGPCSTIGRANDFIMQRNRAALESALGRPVAVRGHTDLAVGDRKFSGNSQRRHKHFLLFHGTFLLDFDLALVGELLLMPSKQPDYRANRSHADFVTNLNVPAEKVKVALRRAWDADGPLKNPPLEQIAVLAREKYATREWNFKF